jgi:hypothetical protein
MKCTVFLSSIAVLFGLGNAAATTGIQTPGLHPSAKMDVQYYARNNRARIRTFPSGQRYISRGGPYIRYVGPNGARSGPIPRSARGG